VNEYTCRAGPQDQPFEERHEFMTIAAVVAGSFKYRAEAGRALLHPGALLLGNCGSCFECGHEHSTGDRCIAFHFAPELFAEIAATAANSGRYRFPVGMLPSAERLAPVFAEVETLAAGIQSLQAAETATRLAEVVLSAASGFKPAPARISARDEQRISAVLRHIERHAEDELDLDALAGVAHLSRYHFLRVFRRMVGTSPYRYVLTTRLRRAALALRTRPSPVSSIAFDAGFGDLSTFTNRFRTIFGRSPGTYRKERPDAACPASAPRP
jgi:AraC-like DNA-binding protein